MQLTHLLVETSAGFGREYVPYLTCHFLQVVKTVLLSEIITHRYMNGILFALASCGACGIFMIASLPFVTFSGNTVPGVGNS